MKLNVVIWKEEDMFVVEEVFTGVSTQGKTIEEVLMNIKEAAKLYLEELPELKERDHRCYACLKNNQNS